MGVQDRDWYHEHHEKLNRSKSKQKQKPLPNFRFPDLDYDHPPNHHQSSGKSCFRAVIWTAVLVSAAFGIAFLKYCR